MTILEEIHAEAERASKRYGDFTSTHEALGVLTEEYHELLDAVRENAVEAVAIEALQVAAVALRIVQACRESVTFFDRSIK